MFSSLYVRYFISSIQLKTRRIELKTVTDIKIPITTLITTRRATIRTTARIRAIIATAP